MKSKKIILIAILSIITLSLYSQGLEELTSTNDDGRAKVILDTDMVECFDDGIAMITLASTPSINLLGVTTVAGNRSMPNGVATGVRQLEIINSTVPIYEGSRYGIRNYRFSEAAIKAEENLLGPIGYAGYARVYQDPKKYGNIDYNPMAKWIDVYRYLYNREPSYKYVYGMNHKDMNGNDGAVNFLINQANMYPGEITLIAIGPTTNIARAILKDPTFPSKIKKIVYMGGSFYEEGNSTAAAEFNWWADPDASKICVRSAWGDQESPEGQLYNNQVISGLEANSNTSGMPQDLYEKMLNTTYPELKDLFMKKNGLKAPSNIWDVLAVGYVINPDIVISWNDSPRPKDSSVQDIYGVYIDVDSEMSVDYGRSIAYRTNKGPVGTKKAAIQNYIDEELFWNDVVLPALVMK